MGIGRREFLRIFGSALSSIARVSSNAIAIFGDDYINRKLGIAFRKPASWTFADVKQMGEVKSGQLLDLDDPQLQRELLEEIELPILSISRDGISANSTSFTPGVTIYIERIDLQFTPLQILTKDIEYSARILKDFAAISFPQTRFISNCEAAIYSSSFLFEHQNMLPTPVRMLSLVINQLPTIYTLRMYDSPYTSSNMTFDYTDFLQSIKIV